MVRTLTMVCVFVMAGIMVVGCGGPPATQQATTPNAFKAAEGSKFVLAAEPASAKSVLEAREEAREGEEIVIVGRVGGSKKPLVKGRVAFTIVDVSLTPCNEIPGDDCPAPWDYCCAPDLAKSMVMVKLVDEHGQTVPEDARDYLGLAELQTVVVQGKAKRDGKGNLTILMSGIHIRKS